LLWFVKTGAGVRYHESKKIAPIRKRVLDAVRTYLGTTSGHVAESASFIEDLGADSLAIVEFVMVLEEEFGVTITDEAAGKIKTIGEVIDFLAR
jgi:acyl carrier protein